MTEGRVHESRVARTLRSDLGTIVVFDRGFTDYAWFSALDADGVYFVTRMKDNADDGVLERRPVPARGCAERDEIIFLYQLARGDGRDLFRQQLFIYRDLFAWIDQSFQPPPLLASLAEQIPFSWSTNLDSRNANLNP